MLQVDFFFKLSASSSVEGLAFFFCNSFAPIFVTSYPERENHHARIGQTKAHKNSFQTSFKTSREYPHNYWLSLWSLPFWFVQPNPQVYPY